MDFNNFGNLNRKVDSVEIYQEIAVYLSVNFEAGVQLANSKHLLKNVMKRYEHLGFLTNQTLRELFSCGELILNGVSIETIPVEVFDLLNLKSLSIHSSELESSNGDWYRLPNLEFLDLSDNNLVELDPSISKLKNLKTLNIQNNNINQIPYNLLNNPNIKIIQ